MLVKLTEELFENDVYEVSYGTKKKAIFSIIQETLLGNKTLEIDRINIVTEDSDGNQTYRSSIIAVGDSECVIYTDDQTLEGSVLKKGNMSSCTVYLNDEDEEE